MLPSFVEKFPHELLPRSFELVAREGDAAPGTAGGTFRSGFLGRPALGDSGEIVFHAHLNIGGSVVAGTDAGLL